MPPRSHILIVNDRVVRQPVFVIGAPHSGTDLLGRALKQSRGFHVTIGQEVVSDVVHAFARSPSIQRGRSDAAAIVLRDALAQAWQVTAHGCLTCSPVCRDAGQVTGSSRCVSDRDIMRYGDATPDLMYCAEELVEAFPDARLVQIVRDGRDVVAAMLADGLTLGWLKRGAGSGGPSEFPNPFLGIETEQDLAAWPELSVAGKCAMRWRGSVRKMARLRNTMPAEQLTTLRYEDLVRDPGGAAAALSAFIGDTVGAIQAGPGSTCLPSSTAPAAIEPGAWRRQLTMTQLSEIDAVAGADLRRVGYGN